MPTKKRKASSSKDDPFPCPPSFSVQPSPPTPYPKPYSDLLGSTFWQSFENIFTFYDDKPLLGTKNHVSGSYEWTSYRSFLTQVENISSSLVSLLPSSSSSSKRSVVICASNSIEWLLADMACLRSGLFSIPVHRVRANDKDSLAFLTEPSLEVGCVICDSDLTARFKALGVEVVIEIGGTGKLTLEGKMQAVPFEDLLNYSSIAPLSSSSCNIVPPATPNSDTNLTLFFSSGSTGLPKGVALTESNLLSDLISAAEDEDNCDSSPPTQLAIYSFAYSLERDNFQTVALLGGKLAIYSQAPLTTSHSSATASMDLSQVFTELFFIKPTTILGVPALWAALHHLYSRWCSSKLHSGEASNLGDAETLVISEMRRQFGEQLEVVSSGTAPLTPENLDFMRRLFPQAFIGEGYGTQETGLLTLENVVQPGVILRLRDVPSLGYTSKDRPWPRGEICVKTESLVAGYYGSLQPDASAEMSFIKGGKLDGFFATGDIGEVRRKPKKKTGGSKAARREARVAAAVVKLYVIDRVKSLFKLSNGEYCSPLALEAIYSSSSLVKQIMVHGEATWDSVVAVVVPSTLDITANMLRDELRSIARFRGLRSHETVSDVCLFNSAEGWTAENGLLTPSLKLNRPVITARCRLALEKLSADWSGANNNKIALISSLLPAGSKDDECLIDLGLDSLSAFRFSNVLDVPLEFLFNPETTVGDLKTVVERGGGKEDSGRQKKKKETEDLIDIDLRLSNNNVIVVPIAEKKKKKKKKRSCLHFFITGATGFLGSVVLAHLLKKHPSARFICLVRANNDTIALQRIVCVLREAKLWVPAYESQLRALAGNLEQQKFGLLRQQFESILTERPVVIHCAAQVSWLQVYSNLRKSNVVGTIEILKLCCSVTPPLKLMHVSTGAAQGLGRSPYELSETSGYAATKAVAEVLVQRAVASKGLRACIVRPGSVGPHSMTGFSNEDDFLSRYVETCFELGHFVDCGAMCEFIPVDFVAEAMEILIDGKLIEEPASQKITSVAPVYAITNPKSPTFTELGLTMLAIASTIHPNSSATAMDSMTSMTPRQFVNKVEMTGCRLQPLLPILEEQEFWDEGAEADPTDELWEVIGGKIDKIPDIDVGYLEKMAVWLVNKRESGSSWKARIGGSYVGM